MKISFIFPTNRKKLVEEVDKGISPDNGLYGLNHLKKIYPEVFSTDVSPWRQRLLDGVFFPLNRLFRSQIKIGFMLGRAIFQLKSINRADVVVTNTDAIGLPICLLKRVGLVKPPIIYAVGLFYIQGSFVSSLEKGKQNWFFRFLVWLFSASDHIVYHSPIEKEKLRNLGLYHPAGCTFLAIGSDGNYFKGIKRSDPSVRQDQILKSGQIILAVGRDHARDYQTLFKAAEKLADHKFVVFCSPRNIEGLAIPGNVEVHFDVPYREVVDWYHKAQMVVIPMREMHRSSGQLSLVDTIQAGKPLIISKVDGISHYGLENNKHNLLVEPENVSELKRAIEKLIESKKIRQKLSWKLSRLATLFNTKKYAEGLEKVIKGVGGKTRLYPLAKKDLEFVRRIRNENRRCFFDSRMISKSAQKKWFEKYRKKQDDYMFVLKDGNLPVGAGAIYQINEEKKSAKVGRFIIDRALQKKGYGKILLQLMEKLVFGELGMTEILLEVLTDNQPALGLYRSQGYRRIGDKMIDGRKVMVMIKSVDGKKK